MTNKESVKKKFPKAHCLLLFTNGHREHCVYLQTWPNHTVFCRAASPAVAWQIAARQLGVEVQR